MKIQRFIGTDSRSAMRKVREALGGDALVLSNRQVDEGIEIIAADGNDELLFGTENSSAMNDRTPKEPAAAKKPIENNAEVAEQVKPLDLASLGDLIKTEKQESDQVKPAPEKSETIPSPYDNQTYTGLGSAAAESKSSANPPILKSIVHSGKDGDQFANSVREAKKKIQAVQQEKEASEKQQIDMMREELSHLRGMMVNQFTDMRRGLNSRTTPAKAKVMDRMTELGLTESLSADIVSSLKNIDSATPQVSARDALSNLANRIKVTGDIISQEGGTFVFIGPAGAGKTTTIAKIALQFTQQYGNDDIVLITTDTSRFGAHEQLSAYGKLLGIPVLRATENDQIRELISAMQNKKMVLVDTAGLTQKDLRKPSSIPTFQIDQKMVKHFAVLPATAQHQTIERLISSLSPMKISGTIITKVDEAANLGELLSSTITHEIAISYWTEKAKITSGMHIANSRRIVEKAVSVLSASRHDNPKVRAARNIGRNQNFQQQQL